MCRLFLLVIVVVCRLRLWLLLLLGLFHRVSVVLGFFVHGSWGSSSLRHSGSVVVNSMALPSQWWLKDGTHVVDKGLKFVSQKWCCVKSREKNSILDRAGQPSSLRNHLGCGVRLTSKL